MASSQATLQRLRLPFRLSLRRAEKPPTYLTYLCAPWGIYKTKLDKPHGVARSDKKGKFSYWVALTKEDFTENKDGRTLSLNADAKFRNIVLVQRDKKETIVTPTILQRANNVQHRFQRLSGAPSKGMEKLAIGLLVALLLGCFLFLFLLYSAMTKDVTSSPTDPNAGIQTQTLGNGQVVPLSTTNPQENQPVQAHR